MQTIFNGITNVLLTVLLHAPSVVVLVCCATPSLQGAQCSHSHPLSFISMKEVKQSDSTPRKMQTSGSGMGHQGGGPPPIPPRKTIPEIEKEIQQLKQEIKMLSAEVS